MKCRDGKSQRKNQKIKSDNRRAEETRSKKRKSEERKRRCAGRRVAKHYVFPIICGSGRSKNRLTGANWPDQR